MKFLHSYGFNCVKFPVFDVFDLENFAIASFSQEYFGFPVVILSKRKVVLLKHILFIKLIVKVKNYETSFSNR